MTAPAPIALLLRDLPAGGVERVTLNLAAGLLARGHPVDLVLFAAEGALLDRVPEGVGVVGLGGPASLGRAPHAAPRVLARLRAYLDRRRPRALIASKEQANLMALLAAGPTRTPTVLVRHVPLDPALVGAEARPAVRLLYRTLYRRAGALVGVSRGIADDIRNRLPGPARVRVHAIANPVLDPEIDRLARAPCPPDLDAVVADGRPLVLASGRLTRQKGFDLLVEAFGRLAAARPAHLVILGEGECRPRLEARIAAHGLEGSITLAGNLANPYPAMRRASVFVLPSRWEGLPTVLIEAMHLGVPVVAADCPTGPHEILDGGRFGALVPPEDPAALAEALAGALDGRTPPPAPAADLAPYTVAAAAAAYDALIDTLAPGER